MKTTYFFTTLLISLFICSKVFSQCISAGPFNATSFFNDASIGTIAWVNPSNVATSDNNYATAGAFVSALSSAYTNRLSLTGFGFSIPSNAVLCGIQVDAERRAQGLLIGSSVTDNTMKIIKNNVILGSEHASGSGWPSVDTYGSYGNNADLWGTAWTPSDINSPNFGVSYTSAALNAGLVALFLSAEIDHVRVTVFYDIILPINLINFSGEYLNGKNQLHWAISTQINNDFFTMERSMDGLNFEQAGIIDGAGNTSSTINYTFTDDKPLKDITYYRLKQIDFDGKFQYSNIITVNTNNYSKMVSIYPNPAKNTLNLSYTANAQQLVTINVYTTFGKHIYTISFVSEKGNIIKPIDISNIESGIYQLEITVNGNGTFKKLLVQ